MLQKTVNKTNMFRNKHVGKIINFQLVRRSIFCIFTEDGVIRR